VTQISRSGLPNHGGYRKTLCLFFVLFPLVIALSVRPSSIYRPFWYLQPSVDTPTISLREEEDISWGHLLVPVNKKVIVPKDMI
jgi:hypothetical protein